MNPEPPAYPIFDTLVIAFVSWLLHEYMHFRGAPPLAFVCLGLLTIGAMGSQIQRLIRALESDVGLQPRPKGISEELWIRLTARGGGGKWIGFFEAYLYFVAFWANVLLVIPGWLVFKAAASWEMAKNVEKYPEEVANIEPLEFLTVRRNWATRWIVGYLVGTMANILIAAIGFALSDLPKPT